MSQDVALQALQRALRRAHRGLSRVSRAGVSRAGVTRARVRKYDIHFLMLLSRSRFPDEDVPLPSCGFR